jgi:O-antigen/teichoic acid export membrane protein
LKLIKDLLFTFSTRIAVVALTFGTTIVVARVLGPQGQGTYSLIILIPTLLAMVGNLGIGIANAYFTGKKKYELSDIASNSTIAALSLGIILATVFLIYFFFFHPHFLGDIEPRAIVLATLVLPSSLLSIYFSYILLGQTKIKEYNLVNLVQGGTLLVLTLFLLLFIWKDVLSPVIAWICAAILAAILSIWLVYRMTGISRRFNYHLFKDSVKFGGQGYLGNIIQFLNLRLDMLLVAMLMNLSFVGYYSIAVPLAEALWYFPAAVGTVIFARTISLSPEEANKSTPRICRNTLFLTFLAAIVLFFLSKYIVLLLFGADFLPALQPLQVLLPGIVAFSVCHVLGNEIAGRGKPVINTINAGISLLINIPLNIVLIPQMGITGAALASTISYIASAIFSVVLFAKISGVSWTALIIMKPEDFRFYRQLLSGVYSLSLDKDRRRILLQQISLELNPMSWGNLPEHADNNVASKENIRPK